MIARLSIALMLAVSLAAAPSARAAEPFQTAAPHALLLDVATGAVLLDKAADEPLQPANMTKIMTAAVLFDALRDGPVTPDTEATITEAIWRKGGAPSRSTTMFAALNSRVKLADLLLGLAVVSANDAALAIADGVAGSEGAFVRRMNAKAQALGMTRTRFENATGFADPNQNSTARDLARLASHVVRTHPERYAAFAVREMTWNRITQRNRNPLLGEHGTDGFLTGGSDETGHGVVASAVQNGQRLVLALGGVKTARERDADAKRVLDWGFRSFELRPLFAARQPVGRIQVFGGEAGSVEVAPSADVAILVATTGADRITARIVYRGPLRPPVMRDSVVAQLRIFRNDALALEVPLVAAGEIGSGGLWTRARDAAWETVGGWVRQGFARVTGRLA